MVDQCTKKSFMATPPKDRKRDVIPMTLRRLDLTGWMTAKQISASVGLGTRSTNEYLVDLLKERAVECRKFPGNKPYLWRVAA